MNKQLSDEQVDRFMRKLMNEIAFDDHSINEIAGSPKIWWHVQSGIKSKMIKTAPWPPSVLKQILMWATPVAAAVAVILAVFLFRSGQTNDNGGLTANNAEPVSIDKIEDSKPIETAVNPETEQTTVKTKNAVPNTTKTKVRTVVKQTSTPSNSTIVGSDQKKAGEVKSAFIALSYARDAESGQIVRVKVPSQMMVSLGLVASVKKPNEMVDAEVVIGDDGLTRAIRFIH